MSFGVSNKGQENAGLKLGHVMGYGVEIIEAIKQLSPWATSQVKNFKYLGLTATICFKQILVHTVNTVNTHI